MPPNRSVLHLDVLGTNFGIRTPDPRWMEWLTSLWAPFEFEGRADIGIRIEAASDSRSWLVSLDDEPLLEHPDPWRVTEVVQDALMEEALLRNKGIVDLHAGAVSKKDQVALFVGKSGTGKTTLTAHFLDNGWNYLSDDLAPITTNGSVLPFPKPLGLKDKRRWGISAAPEWLPPPTNVKFVPATSFAIQLAPAPIRAVVIAGFSSASPTRLNQVSAGQTAFELARNTRRLPDRALRLFTRLTQGVSCYGGTFGSPEEVFELVSRNW